MPIERCRSFLNEKKAWLDKIVSANSALMRENSDIINYKAVYVGGVKLPLIISDKNEITDGAVFVKNVKNIRRLLSKKFSAELVSRAEHISKITVLTANGYSFKTYRGRWGCCDSKKNIVFNCLLFMLPKSLQDYVIVHELCHTVYLNHSPAFWYLVSSYIPEYRELKKQLKKFDFITKLY